MWDWLLNILNFFAPYFRFPNILSLIADVAVVSIVIYNLLLLFKETSAGRLLKGLIVVAVVALFSELLNLESLSFILRNLAPAALIAFVVIFQPELRRALEKVGQGRWFVDRVVRNEKSDRDQMIESFADALIKMARAKVGALVVIERINKLNAIIKTGTILDAGFSAMLLESIFMPKTPLHDGAVIIRDGRITAAGCVLPLSDNDSISKYLGTRHRAAVGMSEKSDATILAVSEETGVISMARGGKLTRYLDVEELKTILGDIYIRERNYNPFNLVRWRTKDETNEQLSEDNKE